jgi:hypothetical protein
MPYEIALSNGLKNRKWKAKIWEKEGPESPHVSIIWKSTIWRWGLRERDFLDDQPPREQVPKELLEILEEQINVLVTTWNTMHPYNLVWQEEDQ